MSNYDTLLNTYNILRADTITEIERVAHTLAVNAVNINYPFAAIDKAPGGGVHSEFTITRIDIGNRLLIGTNKMEILTEIPFDVAEIGDLLHALNCLDGNAYKGATKKTSGK